MSAVQAAARDYLELRRSLGYKLSSYGPPLKDFAAYIEQSEERYVSTTAVMKWLALRCGPEATSQSHRLKIVRGFAEYFRSFDSRTEVPSMSLVAFRRQRPVPYIYKDEEVKALIAAPREVVSPFLADTYSTLLGLLAATGLRLGEARSLDRSDFDPNGAMLLVRDSKGGKSRRVPLHVTTVAALQAYANRRDRLFRYPRSSCLFLTTSGTRVHPPNLHSVFGRFLKQAGMPYIPRHRPRIHDLRHTFAVRTIMDWYRSGADVQALLPSLSTYLGHVCPSCTYWYLSAVPELVCFAAKRLENHIGGLQ